MNRMSMFIAALFGFVLGAVLFKDMPTRESTPPVVIAPVSAPVETLCTGMSDSIDWSGFDEHSRKSVLYALKSSPIYWDKMTYANSESTKREFRQFMATYARGGMIQPGRVSDDGKARARAMSGGGHQLIARTISRPESLTTILSSQARILGWYDPNGILHFVSGISHEESLFVKKQAKEMSAGRTP